VADWGEVPHFIRGRMVRRYINRTLQLSLIDISWNVIPFTASPVYRDLSGHKVPSTVWHQQPAKFPSGYCQMAADDPNWRITYRDNWIAKRKALGLPHAVTDPIWFHKAKPERKRA